MWPILEIAIAPRTPDGMEKLVIALPALERDHLRMEHTQN